MQCKDTPSLGRCVILACLGGDADPVSHMRMYYLGKSGGGRGSFRHRGQYVVCSIDVNSDFKKCFLTSIWQHQLVFSFHLNMLQEILQIYWKCRVAQTLCADQTDRTVSNTLAVALGSVFHVGTQHTVWTGWMDGRRVYPLARFNHKLTQTGLPSTLCSLCTHCSGL